MKNMLYIFVTYCLVTQTTQVMGSQPIKKPAHTPHPTRFFKPSEPEDQNSEPQQVKKPAHTPHPTRFFTQLEPEAQQSEPQPSKKPAKTPNPTRFFTQLEPEAQQSEPQPSKKPAKTPNPTRFFTQLEPEAQQLQQSAQPSYMSVFMPQFGHAAPQLQQTEAAAANSAVPVQNIEPPAGNESRFKSLTNQVVALQNQVTQLRAENHTILMEWSRREDEKQQRLDEQQQMLDAQQQMWNQRFEDLLTTLSSINTQYNALRETIENLAKENQELREKHANLLAQLTDHINTSDDRTKTQVGTQTTPNKPLVSPAVSPIKSPVVGKETSQVAIISPSKRKSTSSTHGKDTPSRQAVRKSIGFINQDDVRQVEEYIEGHEEVSCSLKDVTTLSKAKLNKISEVIVEAMKATGMDRETVINAISNKLENKVCKGKAKLQLDTIKATITTHESDRDATTLAQRDTAAASLEKAAASLEKAKAELKKRQPQGKGQGRRGQQKKK